MKAEAAILGALMTLLLIFIFYPFTNSSIIQITSNGGIGTNCDNNSDCNITGRINTPYDANFNRNINLDGNLIAKDENTFIGDTSATGRNDIIYNGLTYNAWPTTNGSALTIPVNTCAFGVSGQTVCEDFNGQIRAIGFGSPPATKTYIGVTGNADGIILPFVRNTLPNLSGSNQKPHGALFDWNYGESVELTIYGPSAKPHQVGTKLYEDANFTTNVSIGKDGNIYGSLNVDKNIFVNDDTNTQGRIWMNGLSASSAVLQALGLDANGQLVRAVSDASYKTNIQPLLNTVDTNRLYQVQFRSWTDIPSNSPGYGVIAQEIEPIFPQVVITMKDGKKAVDYRALAIFEMVEIQKKNKQIGDLNAKVTIQATQIELLHTSLCTINPLLNACVNWQNG